MTSPGCTPEPRELEVEQLLRVLTLVERGSATNTILGSYCNSPMFRRTGPWEPQQDAVSTLEVTDGTLTLRMKVIGLGVARTAHLVEPADKLLTAGEEVLIEKKSRKSSDDGAQG
jgi:hypothetical protein